LKSEKNHSKIKPYVEIMNSSGSIINTI